MQLSSINALKIVSRFKIVEYVLRSVLVTDMRIIFVAVSLAVFVVRGLERVANHAKSGITLWLLLKHQIEIERHSSGRVDFKR